MNRARRGAHAIERVSSQCVFEDRGYTSPCRIFTGPKDPNGYGQIQIGKTTKRTHIVTYEFSIGPVPSGLELDHLCRQKDCCATSHLEAVTHQVNVSRGRVGEVNRARAVAVTHCPKGHEYTPENTRIIKHRDGYPCRACKECNRERMRVNYQRRKAAAIAAGIACLLLIPMSASAANRSGVAGGVVSVKAPMLPPVGDYPDAECNYDASGDIYVGPDGSFWECICERRVFIDDDCAWYNQGAARASKLKKRIQAKYHVRIVARNRVWVMA